jgi:hypothetical protein
VQSPKFHVQSSPDTAVNGSPSTNLTFLALLAGTAIRGADLIPRSAPQYAVLYTQKLGPTTLGGTKCDWPT